MRKLLFTLVVCTFLLLIGLTLYQEQAPSAGTVTTEPPVLQTEPTLPPATVPTEVPTLPTETEPPETQPTEPPEEALFFPVAQEEAYNQELQKYVTEQAQVDGNRIILTGIRDGEEYLSGKVESKVAFRYGTFAFRIKTVQQRGLFPAIWMLPLESARYPEVDIYEMIGSRPYRIHCGIHYGSEENAKLFFSHTLQQFHLDDGYVLKFVWSEGRMDWYVDDMLIGTNDYNIPDTPMYLILNLAIGGEWAGFPLESSLPGSFEVEVVQFEPVEIFAR